MIEALLSGEVLASLAALTVMEIVLGVDNIIFISILASRLPQADQSRARLIGLALACILRVGLIFAIGWIISLSQPFFTLFHHPFAGRDLILLGGGLFLIYKATKEIHNKLEGSEDIHEGGGKKSEFGSVVLQITLLNIVFSLDSIITAVGMTSQLQPAIQIETMIIAVVVSLGFMLATGRPVGDFVMRHPTVKMLALAFLLMIGMTLVAESFHFEIPKGYVYSAMAFSVFVEMLNLWAKKRQQNKGKKLPEPVHLHQNVTGVPLAQEENGGKK